MANGRTASMRAVKEGVVKISDFFCNVTHLQQGIPGSDFLLRFLNSCKPRKPAGYLCMSQGRRSLLK